tara:strand:+ start:1728 stop:2828 length:1101 start_codon:yes stop_codon:yes gene_type:complete
MNVYKAIVKDRNDTTHSLGFWAQVEGLSANEADLKPIIYTSPFGARSEGGMIAVPEINHPILVMSIGDDKGELYYLASVWAAERGAGDKEVKATATTDLWRVSPEPGVYGPRLKSSRDYPQKILIKDARGNKIVLKDRISEKAMDTGIELKTPKGKRVALLDSEYVDCIKIETAGGDGLTIGDQPPRAFGPSRAIAAPGAKSIKLESRYSHQYISREAGMTLTVEDGRDMQLLNNSGGSNAANPTADGYGNIRLKSKRRDLMLTAKGTMEELNSAGGTGGRIFLNCSGLCQIEAGGKLVVSAIEGIEIITDGDFKVKAKNINLESTNSTNLVSQGNINADGSKIYLNSGESTGAGTITTIVDRYGD